MLSVIAPVGNANCNVLSASIDAVPEPYVVLSVNSSIALWTTNGTDSVSYVKFITE